jgi:hypothetical protein
MKRWLLLVAAISALSLPWRVSATSVLSISFEDLVAKSVTIIRGEAVAVRSQWRDRSPDSPIVTIVTIRVLETLKGEPIGLLDLEFLGGSIGGRTLAVSDMPRFQVGDRDFLFINSAGRPMNPLVGFFPGRWPIRVDAFTGREYVTTFDGRALSDVRDVSGRAGVSLSGLRSRGSTALSPSEAEAQIRQQVATGR